MATTGQVKQKLDGLPSIDISVMRKYGALEEGRTSELSWLRDDQYLGGYKVTVSKDRLHIVCQMPSLPQPITETIQLSYFTHYRGGRHSLMACPGCSRRSYRLYISTTCIRCLHCFKLTYRSRSENVGYVDQLVRSVRNSRKKLGASDDMTVPLQRPKWMRRAKYDRLMAEVEKHQQQLFGYMEDRL